MARIYKYEKFSKETKKATLTDEKLIASADEIEQGLFEADHVR